MSLFAAESILALILYVALEVGSLEVGESGLVRLTLTFNPLAHLRSVLKVVRSENPVDGSRCRTFDRERTVQLVLLKGNAGKVGEICILATLEQRYKVNDIPYLSELYTRHATHAIP